MRVPGTTGIGSLGWRSTGLPPGTVTVVPFVESRSTTDTCQPSMSTSVCRRESD